MSQKRKKKKSDNLSEKDRNALLKEIEKLVKQVNWDLGKKRRG